MLYVENSDNPEYKNPLPKVKVKKNKKPNKSQEDNINQASIDELINLGFDRKKVVAALKMSNGNIANAVEFLFSNTNLGEDDINMEAEDKKEEKMDLVGENKINDGNGNLYNLY